MLISRVISVSKSVLTYIFGIGPTRARKIIAETGVNPDIRVKDLSEAEAALLREFIAKNLQSRRRFTS